METSRFEEENTIENVKNLCRLEKLKEETIDTTIKDLRNLLRLEKENRAIKDRKIIDIKNLFERGDVRHIFRFFLKKKIIEDRILGVRNFSELEEEENYYKSVRVSNFWSNNYMEYETNSDRNKTL